METKLQLENSKCTLDDKNKNMRYAGIIVDDIVDSMNGISLSFWTQGCPFHCKGCHNPQTWDPSGGLPVPEDIDEFIKEKLHANGIIRNFSILGGEPLYGNNVKLVRHLVELVSKFSPSSKIYIWTGYKIENLIDRAIHERDFNSNNDLYVVLSKVNYLIDGQYEEENRDTINLMLRGSSNQRIFERFDRKILKYFTVCDFYYKDITKEVDYANKVRFNIECIRS